MYAGMPIVGFVLSFCMVATATALLVPILRERRKSRLLAPMRGLACDAPGGIGISVLCCGVYDPEQIRNLLSVEYADYEVIAVLDAARYPEEFAALVSDYRMIRVEWTPTGELAVEGIRSIGRSRKRRFRRLVLVNRAADTAAGDFDAAAAVAAYDYLLPVEADRWLLPGAIERLVAEAGEAPDGTVMSIRSPFGAPMRLLAREAVIAAGGYAGRPERTVPRKRRRTIWRPLMIRREKPSRLRRAAVAALLLLLAAGIVWAAATDRRSAAMLSLATVYVALAATYVRSLCRIPQKRRPNASGAGGFLM